MQRWWRQVADPGQEIAFQTAGYEVEPPEVMERNINVGVRLLCAAMVSFFGAFLFAYVYLKERDQEAVWRPAAVKVPLGTGIAVLACVMVSALLTAVAVAALRQRGEAAWRAPALISLLLVYAALGVQCYQWASLPFGPGSGPYASVFVAWTGFYGGVALLTSIYWMQTMLAGSIRHREVPPGPVVSVAGRAGGDSGLGALSARLGVEARSFAFYWYFLAGVQVVTFLLLYIVA
jgi:heme/copper-type cytochrome/quinol oxidase subunit 3